MVVSSFLHNCKTYVFSDLLEQQSHLSFFSYSQYPPKILYCTFHKGTRCWWSRWLRHCATSQKVAGSIPDGVTGIFHWQNPSGRTMALGLTKPLTEMSTSNISWGKRSLVVGLTNFMGRLSWNLGASPAWNPLGLYRSVMGLLYLYFS
jgi:hypothetical protein